LTAGFALRSVHTTPSRCDPMNDDYKPFEGKIDKEDFEYRIKSKIKEFQGLLTREGAVAIIASELGIGLKEKPSDISIKVSDIIEGTTNIELVGKITRISEPKTFVRRTTGTEGKVQRLELTDESGSIAVVLWDDKVDDAGGLGEGDVVVIHGGFAKKGLNGRLELTVQRRGTIEPSDEIIDVKERRLERVEIGSLEEGMGDLKVIGAVLNVSDIREYERQGRSFKVCSMFLKDNTGQIRVSLWNENAEKTVDRSAGDIVEIENCYCRYGFNGLEIQTNSYTRINLDPDLDGLSLPTIDTEVKISEINPEMQFFKVCGIVNRKFEPRTFERDDGSVGKVASLELDDGSGTCRVSLWDDMAQSVETLPVGTEIVLEGCKAREGLDGIEISVGNTGRVMPRLPEIGQYTVRPTGLARGMEVKDGAIKAISKEGELLLITEEQSFSPGDLISYNGELTGDGIRASSVVPSDEEYPGLDELLSPPTANLDELSPETVVRLQGLVRNVMKVKDYNMLRLDDGSSTATGYLYKDGVKTGDECNIIARTFSNGERVQFYAHSVDVVDDIDESYRLLELF